MGWICQAVMSPVTSCTVIGKWKWAKDVMIMAKMLGPSSHLFRIVVSSVPMVYVICAAIIILFWTRTNEWIDKTFLSNWGEMLCIFVHKVDDVFVFHIVVIFENTKKHNVLRNFVKFPYKKHYQLWKGTYCIYKSGSYTHGRLWSVLLMELSNSAKIELLHASIHSLEQVGVLVQLTNFDGTDD